LDYRVGRWRLARLETHKGEFVLVINNDAADLVFRAIQVIATLSNAAEAAIRPAVAVQFTRLPLKLLEYTRDDGHAGSGGADCSCCGGRC